MVVVVESPVFGMDRGGRMGSGKTAGKERKKTGIGR